MFLHQVIVHILLNLFLFIFCCYYKWCTFISITSLKCLFLIKGDTIDFLILTLYLTTLESSHLFLQFTFRFFWIFNVVNCIILSILFPCSHPSTFYFLPFPTVPLAVSMVIVCRGGDTGTPFSPVIVLGNYSNFIIKNMICGRFLLNIFCRVKEGHFYI